MGWFGYGMGMVWVCGMGSALDPNHHSPVRSTGSGMGMVGVVPETVDETSEK